MSEGNCFYQAEEFQRSPSSDSSRGSVGPAFPSQFQFSAQRKVDGVLESTASPSAGNPSDAISAITTLHSNRETSSQGRTPQALPQSCKWVRSEINQLQQTDQLNPSCLPAEQLNLGGGTAGPEDLTQQSHWERGKLCIYHFLLPHITQTLTVFRNFKLFIALTILTNLLWQMRHIFTHSSMDLACPSFQNSDRLTNT